MKKDLIISFPHMGDYHIVIKKILSLIYPGQKVISCPPITKKTLEIGNLNSPDYICAPFKFNIGNYIEVLDIGANILFQTGTGCRYGYYGEIQEQILKDLGYKFDFLWFTKFKLTPMKAYKEVKKSGSTVSFIKFIYAIIYGLISIKIMDRFDDFMRKNMSFEIKIGSFEKLKKELLETLSTAKNIRSLLKISNNYFKKIKRIELKKDKDFIKIGIVGELYTLMEPFTNFYLEKELAKYNVSVSRKMSVTFLLFGKKDSKKLKHTGKYLKNTIGANGIDSVSQSKKYAELGYDGIIHMKSFGCTPEVNAMPALNKISEDYKIPILYFSFDSNTSETGVLTRIEAFIDMIKMKKIKENENGNESVFGY